MPPSQLLLHNFRHCTQLTQFRNLRLLSSSAVRPSTTPSLPSPSSSQLASLPRTIASLLHPGDISQQQQTFSEQAQTDADPVTVCGWVRSVRRLKNVSFASLSDGSTSTPFQAVLTKDQAAGLSTGASVRLTGQWKKSTGAGQAHELKTEYVQVLGAADPETYPLQKKFHTPEFLRSIPHMRPRLASNATFLRLRSLVSSELTGFFSRNEFVQCYPPIITSSDCEGAGEVFLVSSNDKASVPFFRTPKYLTVSTQLHLEALAAAVSRVWTLSPTFRAEKSTTNRHLSEFYMLEAEMSFIETLEPMLNLIETMIRELVTTVRQSRVGTEILQNAGEEKKKLESRWDVLMHPNRWTRISYTSAIELLQTESRNKNVHFVFPPRWGASLQSEHEKFLANHFNGPVFVTDYPREIKPFYMLPSVPVESGAPEAHAQSPGQTVACFDLLLPAVGELIGGSLREHRHDEFVHNMKSHGLLSLDDDGIDINSDEGLGWYAELRQYGSVPHGGFGMGMERLLCYLANMENIREAVAFPRWSGRCDC